ncbi:unnamed protein product [Moneuplotes crassus]|uniref:Uncharacterized protein n=1 Tax=Euplotes crassus TaxID=5936 RepID=A0AAD2CY56_EUPCR|nr:unnamed protein product [Moneuplotes crassus]
MYQSIVYSMTKGFIRFFTLGLGSEAEKNLDIFLVSPGFVSTYMCDFRKEADTISPETCVSNAVRALGQLEQTETSMMCRFLSRYLFESIWYLSDEITRAIFNKYFYLEENQKMVKKMRQREIDNYGED